MAAESRANPSTAEQAHAEEITGSRSASVSSNEMCLQLASSLTSTPMSDWIRNLKEYVAKSPNADLSTLWDVITSHNVDVGFYANSIMGSLP